MKSIAVLLLIGAIDAKRLTYDHTQLSNAEHNQMQDYFFEHPQSMADKKAAWNEGMLHHTTDDYVSEAPAGYMMMQSRSDPCVGMGCDLHTVGSKTAFGDFPKNYKVPNFGQDPDMVTTMSSLDIAQNATGHKLVMGTKESKAQWHNKATDTKYDFN